MTSDLSTIVAKLGLLSTTDLQTVQTTASYLLTGKAQVEIKEDEEDLFMFYTYLSKALSEKGINPQPWEAFKKRRTKLFQELKQKFSITTVYTLRYFGNLKSKDRRRLYKIYGFVLVNWVDSNPVIPLTITSTIRMVDRLPEFMANAFPGYAESELLPLILDLGRPSNSEKD